MGASIQITHATIRGGPKHEKLGDEWEWRVDVRSHPERPWIGVVEGAYSLPGSTESAPKNQDLIKEFVQDMGYLGWGWLRIRDGKRVYREWLF